jgi:hypothetical protein
VAYAGTPQIDERDHAAAPNRTDGPRRGADARRTAGPAGRALAVLSVGFVVSRIGYWLLGVRFDASGLDYASQLVDPDLLRDRLVESVWYFHAQPPAFNLLVGIVLRWSPLAPSTSLHAVFVVFGMALMVGLWDLGRQLGLRRWALAAALVVGCAPTTVLYENWLSYEYPVAVVLVLLVDATAHWVRGGHTGALAAATALAATATLARSLLHPIWFLAVVAMLLVLRRPPRLSATVVAAVLLPSLLVAGAMIKNEVLFGSPALSSWLGFNLHKVTVDSLPADVRDRLYAEGTLRSGEPPDCEVQRPDVPVLAEKYKRDWRGRDAQIRNMNYECLRPYFDDLGSEAEAAARAEPGWAAKGVIGSFEVWASPSDLYPGIYPNRNQIDRIETLYRRTALLDVPWDPPVPLQSAWGIQASAPDHRFHLSITVIGSTLLVLAAAALVLARRRDGIGPAGAALVVGAATIAFAVVAGNLFEHGENNRIRFVVEPLTFILAIAVVTAGGRVVQGMRPVRRDRSGPTGNESAGRTATGPVTTGRTGGPIGLRTRRR